MAHTEHAAEPFDPLRDGPLRYCGYANEVGEAVAAWLPPLGVPFSYAVAVAYVLVDTYDKAAAAHREAAALQHRPASGAAPSDSAPDAVDLSKIVRLLTSERAVDTLIWQLLASVILPGFTIHQVVYFSHVALNATAHLDAPQAMPAAAASTVAALAGVSAQSVPEVLPVIGPCAAADMSRRSEPAFAFVDALAHIIRR